MVGLNSWANGFPLRKVFPTLKSYLLLTIFCPRSLKISGFKLRPLTQLELIFMQGDIKRSNSIFYI